MGEEEEGDDDEGRREREEKHVTFAGGSGGKGRSKDGGCEEVDGEKTPRDKLEGDKDDGLADKTRTSRRETVVRGGKSGKPCNDPVKDNHEERQVMPEKGGRGDAETSSSHPKDPAVTAEPKPDQPEKSQRDDKAGKPQRDDTAGKPQRDDKPDRPQRDDKPDKPQKDDEPQRSNKPDKPQQDGKPSKPQKGDNPDKPQKDDKPPRSNKPDKPQQDGKTDRPQKGDKSDKPQKDDKPDKLQQDAKPIKPQEDDKPDNPQKSNRPSKPQKENKPDKPHQDNSPDIPQKNANPDQPHQDTTPVDAMIDNMLFIVQSLLDGAPKTSITERLELYHRCVGVLSQLSTSNDTRVRARCSDLHAKLLEKYGDAAGSYSDDSPIPGRKPSCLRDRVVHYGKQVLQAVADAGDRGDITQEDQNKVNGVAIDLLFWVDDNKNAGAYALLRRIKELQSMCDDVRGLQIPSDDVTEEIPSAEGSEEEAEEESEEESEEDQERDDDKCSGEGKRGGKEEIVTDGKENERRQSEGDLSDMEEVF